MAALALVGIAITTFVVPKPSRPRVHREAETVPALLGSTLRNPELLRLDFGIFALHAMLTASFLVVPELLHGTLGVSSRDQWFVYLPVLAVSVAIMVPAIIIAERHRRMKTVLVGAVAALAASQLMLAVGGHEVYVLIAAITFFFAAFNIMEASLPSSGDEDGTLRLDGYGDGDLFELAISGHLRRRRGRRLGQSDCRCPPTCSSSPAHWGCCGCSSRAPCAGQVISRREWYGWAIGPRQTRTGYLRDCARYRASRRRSWSPRRDWPTSKSTRRSSIG